MVIPRANSREKRVESHSLPAELNTFLIKGGLLGFPLVGKKTKSIVNNVNSNDELSAVYDNGTV